jgi:hypothetical protein
VLRTLLLNMPFVSLARPAIGVSLLKARLAEEGYSATVAYGSLFFAERVGLPSYEMLLERVSPAMFVGDWLFSQWLFPERDHSTYIATLKHHLAERPADFESVMAMRDEIRPFLEACLTQFHIGEFDIVGFTTTFEQNLASLALAHMVKARFPAAIIIFGGANV